MLHVYINTAHPGNRFQNCNRLTFLGAHLIFGARLHVEGVVCPLMVGNPEL